MSRSRLILLLCAALFLPPAASADSGCRAAAAVCEGRSSGSLALIERGKPIQVLVDDDDHAAAKLAAA